MTGKSLTCGKDGGGVLARGVITVPLQQTQSIVYEVRYPNQPAQKLLAPTFSTHKNSDGITFFLSLSEKT